MSVFHPGVGDLRSEAPRNSLLDLGGPLLAHFAPAVAVGFVRRGADSLIRGQIHGPGKPRIAGLRQTETVAAIIGEGELVADLSVAIVDTAANAKHGISVQFLRSPGNAQAGCKVREVRRAVLVPVWAIAPARLEIEAISAAMTFAELVEEVVAQTDVDGKIRSYLPLVLNKSEVLGLGIGHSRIQAGNDYRVHYVGSKVGQAGIADRAVVRVVIADDHSPDL